MLRKILLSLWFLPLALTREAAPVSRYVSTWTPVPAFESVLFEHGLGGRPLELDVWVAPFVGQAYKGQCAVDFAAAIPLEEVDALEVQAVHLDGIFIYNRGDELRCVQVVASP